MKRCWCGRKATDVTLTGDPLCIKHLPPEGFDDELAYAFMTPLDDIEPGHEDDISLDYDDDGREGLDMDIDWECFDWEVGD